MTRSRHSTSHRRTQHLPPGARRGAPAIGAALLAVLLGVMAPAPALAAGGERKQAFTESYLPMNPFLTSIVQDRRIRGSLTVEIGLDIPDAELREKTKLILPRLQDRYVQTMSLFAATSLRTNRPVDVNRLARALQIVTDKTLESEGAQVLLVNVMVRPN